MEYRMVLIDGDALVVVFDMCSSSDVLEELTLSGDLWRYDELLTSIKEYLANAQGKVLFDPYKFTGDGWILLFPASTIRRTGVRVPAEPVPLLQEGVQRSGAPASWDASVSDGPNVRHREGTAQSHKNVRAARVHRASLERRLPAAGVNQGQGRLPGLQGLGIERSLHHVLLVGGRWRPGVEGEA